MDSRSPIYIEDSFDSGHATLGDRSASSASTANATLGDKADGDSSIELVQPKGSPLSVALRHFALGQRHLQEAIAVRNSREQICTPSTSSLSSSPLPELASIFGKPRKQQCRVPLGAVKPASVQTTSKRGIRTSSRQQTTDVKGKKPLDWDDPVISADLDALSDGSDLPDWPPKKANATCQLEQASDQAKGKASPARQPFQAVNPASRAQCKPTIQQKADPKLLRELRAEGKRVKQEETLQKDEAKAAEVASWKNKYRQFDYQREGSIAPKVWYFKGKEAQFVLCDTKNPHPEVRTLEEVVASLKGCDIALYVPAVGQLTKLGSDHSVSIWNGVHG